MDVRLTQTSNVVLTEPVTIGDMIMPLDDTGKEIHIGVTDEERGKRRAVLDKTSGKDLEKKWANEDREEIEAKERRSGPPIIVEPRCTVCTSEHRQWIERQLIKGQGYQTIANHVPPDGEGKKLSRKAIGNHSKNHMSIDRTVIRAELEAEADFLKQDYEEGIKGALSLRGMLNVIVRKAYDDHINGMTTTEIKDLIQLVKLMNEMNTDESSIKSEETEAALRIFLRAIQNVCSQETQHAIAAETARLRQLDDLDFQVEGHLIQQTVAVEVEDATVVEYEDASN